MKVKLNCRLLSIEEKVSKKGNSYRQCLVYQGTDTMKCMLDSELKDNFDSKIDKDVTMELDYNVRFGSMIVTKIY